MHIYVVLAKDALRQHTRQVQIGQLHTRQVQIGQLNVHTVNLFYGLSIYNFISQKDIKRP
jgi:hypothetical protein